MSESSVRPLYLNGAWVTTARREPVVDPADGQPFAEVSTVGRQEVAQALADADAAFASWRALPARRRGELLYAMAARLEARAEEVARTMTRENGKPVAQSRVEVAASVDHLRWFAEEGRRAYGRVIPPQVPGKRHLVVKTPVGVVGAISPWNFPLMLAARKVAPALAAGCPVVLKPAQKTPLVALALAACAHEAGLPPGVFQVVCGKAADLGAELLENPRCRKITFTGSTEVGQLLIRGAAARVLPLSLELGGHAPLIVFDDADLDRAVEGTLAAKFRNTGQSCIAANRIYVQRGIAARFIDAFAARVRALKTGPGLDDGVDVGPLIDGAAVEKATRHVDDAVSRGARILCGGRALADRPGFFFAPTVLADVPEGAVCMGEETFAPVTPIAVFDQEDEVIARANASRYGLAAYAFTRDLERLFRLAERLEAGTIGINDGVPSTSNAPFGGMKQSGWGRELGSEGLDAFLDTKHVSIGVDGI